MTNKKNAIVLLSGGLDSATVLAIAQSQGFNCNALSFSYGQRHSAELNAATQIAIRSSIDDHKIFDIDLSVFKGSALTDQNIDVPHAQPGSKDIPATYVPARNTVFLAIALAWAEVLEVNDIFIGVNAVDYSGYPDCRVEYIKSFESMANLATRAGVEGNVITIHTPLIELSKADIITLGSKLGVDYALTVSCYSASKNGEACGNCDACHFRRQGFIEAGIADPTLYI